MGPGHGGHAHLIPLLLSRLCQRISMGKKIVSFCYQIKKLGHGTYISRSHAPATLKEENLSNDIPESKWNRWQSSGCTFRKRVSPILNILSPVARIKIVWASPIFTYT